MAVHQVRFPANFQAMNNVTPSAVLCKDATGLVWVVSVYGKLNGVAGQYVFTWRGGSSIATLVSTPHQNARGRLVMEYNNVYLLCFHDNGLSFIDLPGFVPEDIGGH